MAVLQVLLLMLCAVSLGSVSALRSSIFEEELQESWGGAERLRLVEGGKRWQLTLDKVSGSGFQSKKEYHLGEMSMDIKLVAGNSAGTVTAYYLSSASATASQSKTHDEIDFEFLGNVSGEPYIMHTNVFADGKGNREQQFYLWFDPTESFHRYSVSWNTERIVFSVDGVPVRVFKNKENELGAGFYPRRRPMKMFTSLWNADDWATRGGLVKTDWSKAPFVASFQNFSFHKHGKSEVSEDVVEAQKNEDGGEGMGYDEKQLKWVREHFLVYDYCLDTHRFPQGPPPECKDTSSSS